MVQFCPLCSGSSGNSVYVGTKQTGLLIDAGRSCQYILKSLQTLEIAPDAVQAILVTHDHHDHISALRVLNRRLKCPIYASPETLQAIWNSGAVESDEYLRALPPVLSTAGMEVRSFDTPHDAAHSVGFRIETANRVIGFATDLGKVTEAVWNGLLGCDLVMLESNYDERMLRMSRYPQVLKERIRSDLGHLSNADSADCIRKLAQQGTARFYLGHLSRENNLPELAEQQVQIALSEAGLEPNRDYQLHVAKRLELSTPIVF